VESSLFDRDESEPIEQTPRGIERFDVEADGYTLRRRFGLQIVQELRADPRVAMPREDRDVEHANLGAGSHDEEPPDGLVGDENYVVAGLGKPLSIVRELRCELRVEKRPADGFVRGELLELENARGGEDVEEEPIVFRASVAERYLGSVDPSCWLVRGVRRHLVSLGHPRFARV
jgi:hypothetical protein